MTFIDVLVGIVLILTVFIGLFGAFQLSVRLVSSAKGEAGASALVDSQMEYVRSLPYGEVGVTGGSPAGILSGTSVVTENGAQYSLATSIRYVDDPADGAGAADTNGNTNDYKVVTVTASWLAPTGAVQSLSATSYVAPPGVESN